MRRGTLAGRKEGAMIADRDSLPAGAKKRFTHFRQRVESFKYARENYLKTYRKDPLAFWLVNKLRLSPLRGAWLGAGIVCLTYLIGVFLYLVQNRQIAGITQTAIDIVYDFTLIPLIYGYYIWVSTTPPVVLFKLSENGVSMRNAGDYNKLVEHLSGNVINHKSIFLFSFAAALTTASIYFYKAVTYPNIWGDPADNFWVLYLLKIPITWTIPWYMACVIFLKQVAAIWSFNQLLQHPDLKINMFHPDRCGGLKPVGDYLIRFTYLMMGCGFGFVLLIYRSIEFKYFEKDILVHLCLIAYLLLSVFFFYFPFHPVNRLMKRLKREIQERLEQRRFLPSRAFTPAMFGQFILATTAPFFLLIALIIF